MNKNPTQLLQHQNLNEAYVEAIQAGKLDQFIESLNRSLRDMPQNFRLWLFVARAYDAKGDIENAANSYAFLLKIAKPYLPVNRLVAEIKTFAARSGRADLATLAGKLLQANEATQPKPYLQKPLNQAPQNKHPLPITVTAPAPTKPESPTRPESKNSKKKKSRAALSKLDLTVQENVIAGRQAFQAGELEVALERFTKALEGGDRSPQTFLAIGQSLQRLQRYEEALKFLDESIDQLRPEHSTSVLNLKAQILQSQGYWEGAANTYIALIRQETRPAARRFCRLQLASLLLRLGKKEQAAEVINRVLSEFPQDQVASRLLAAVEKPIVTADPMLSIDEQQYELTVELQEEGIDLISPMLRRDLEVAEFHDEQILLQGRQPTVSDANRLMKKAEEKRGTEFGERYPLFLEAAKAYNELPKGSYNLEKLYIALTRYSMLKGGAFVSELRRQILSGHPNIDKLRRLRDSATSYYLESVALQVRTKVTFIVIPLTNYLRAQLAYTLCLRKEPIPVDLFERNFADLFSYCVDSGDDLVARIAYESMVAWGAASSRVWDKLRHAGVGGVVRSTLKTKRVKSYRVLSSITGHDFSLDQRPGEVLSTSFLDRRRQIRDLVEFFTRVRGINLDIQTVRGLFGIWQKFPSGNKALLDTDLEIVEGLGAILQILLPFRDRSAEERTGILFSARTNTENWLRFIDENPTYWGRVELQPLLTRWQTAIRELEKRRLSEIQPKITARLEPPVFRVEGTHIEGGLSLRNEGRGTADGVKLRITLTTSDTKATLAEFEDAIRDEIKAREGTYHYPIRIASSILSNGLSVPYRLQLEIVPIFSRAELDSTEEEFTLEITSGTTFSKEDIPWNEVQIPPEHLFKGREAFIDKLVTHLKSSERHKTYILYGLTRTGKTSILRYLGKELDFKTFTSAGVEHRFISFEWRLDTAANQSDARDMWGYFLRKQIIGKLEDSVESGALTSADIPELNSNNSFRFKDWEAILSHLRRRNLFPVFLLDEFPYYRELVDKKRIDASFLAAIRDFAISGRASFVFAGTYDLRKLIKDPAYGITGQFVNAIEVKVSRIEKEHAVKLIRVMEPKLIFTPDALDHILHLTYQIPYFIQLLCRNCAVYALKSGRNVIGFPEVESVVKVLTGEKADAEINEITPLVAAAFSNNMYTPTDPTEFDAVLSTICDLVRQQLNPRMVTYPEIQEVWHHHGLRAFQAGLAEAVQELTEREILIAGEDEQEFAYHISVDLFRRWWANEHRNLTLELDRLKEDD